jgi:T4 RnlA family RNA ligase
MAVNILLDYIRNHIEWRKELVEKPYCISIKDDGPYTLFGYNMIDSDFKLPIVQVCRGIILKNCDSSDPIIVCQAFNKFFNYNEPNAHSIDWNTARIQEKIDGSIIKVWFDDGAWHVSTNGVIDAHNAGLQVPQDGLISYYDLFSLAAINAGLDYNKLRANNTWIFELVSPWNRIVVPYKETTIYHIGARYNLTGLEFDEDIGIQKPHVYSFASWEDMVKTTAELPFDREGYVVVDNNWSRVKVKSLAYLQAHHIKNNGNINPDRVLELIRSGNDTEFVEYFPEYKEHFDKIRVKYRESLDYINKVLYNITGMRGGNRKDFAMWVMKNINEKMRKYCFTWYDGKEKETLAKFDSCDYDDLI